MPVGCRAAPGLKIPRGCVEPEWSRKRQATGRGALLGISTGGRAEVAPAGRFGERRKGVRSDFASGVSAKSVGLDADWASALEAESVGRDRGSHVSLASLAFPRRWAVDGGNPGAGSGVAGGEIPAVSSQRRERDEAAEPSGRRHRCRQAWNGPERSLGRRRGDDPLG